jgi:hypothetical protein
MTNSPSQPNIAAIRQLLLAAFAPDDLRRFCYDRSTFRPVVDELRPLNTSHRRAPRVCATASSFLDRLPARAEHPGWQASHPTWLET